MPLRHADVTGIKHCLNSKPNFERRVLLRCNLPRLDERPSHNGPPPAQEGVLEQVCSLDGDYIGFTTDLTHSYAQKQNSHSNLPVGAAADCHRLFSRCVFVCVRECFGRSIEDCDEI